MSGANEQKMTPVLDRKKARAAKRLRKSEKNRVDLAAMEFADDKISKNITGIGGVLLALKHPRAFWRAGVAAASEKNVPTVTLEAYRVRLSMTVVDYLKRYFQKPFLGSLLWHGIPTLKMPSDLWMYQEILFRCEPEVVVEIGSHYGGSTLFLAEQMDALGRGEVISVDNSRAVFMADHPRISLVTGDCSSTEVIAEVRERIGNRTAMVVHDADHSEAAVQRDLDLYAPFVSVGQYLIVEDGVLDLFDRARYQMRDGGAGPLQAIFAFLAEQSGQFEIDEMCERFVLTASPRGFLKRVR